VKKRNNGNLVFRDFDLILLTKGNAGCPGDFDRPLVLGLETGTNGTPGIVIEIDRVGGDSNLKRFARGNGKDIFEVAWGYLPKG